MPAIQTVREAYAQAVLRLSGAGVASPEAEAWQLLEAATGISRSRLMTERRELIREEQRQLGEWLARRELREPLQLILRRAYFYGLEIPVEPGVLVPRPETERLVELTLQRLSRVTEPCVLDVGTGSGAIALALKSERPDARVAATDIDEIALERARENARALGLDIEFHRGDLLAGPVVARIAAEAHVVVANPPYLPAADRDVALPEVHWDPAGALYAGDDGLSVFRRLVQQAFGLLRRGSLLIVELDPRNIDRAASDSTSWAEVEVHHDLVGRRRFLLLVR